MEGGQGARPSSSFGRPSTSRPGTSFGQAYHLHGHAEVEPTYEVEGEYEEESDDEDVFAFLPPSTADQEPEREQQQQQQQEEVSGRQEQPQGLAPYYQNPFAHDPFIPSSSPSTTNSGAFGAPVSTSNSYANYAFATLQYADRAPSQPQPTVNPTMAAAEAPHPFVPRDTSGLGAQTQVQDSGGYLHPPPLSPPSTDSQPSTGYGATGQDNSFKLKRMSASVPDADKGKEGARMKLRTSVVNEEVESTASRSNAGSPVQAVGKGGEKAKKVSGEKSRKSREEDADTSAVTTDVDLGVDLEGGVDGDVTVKDANRSRSRDRRRKKRSANHRSAGASGVNPSPAVGTGEGIRRRSKNVNASPYYAYAQFNNARHGLETAHTTDTSRMNTTSPISGKTMINGSSHSYAQSSFPLTHRRQSNMESPTVEGDHDYSHRRGGSNTSSYVAQQKRRETQDEESMVETLSFEGGRERRIRVKGDFDEEDGYEDEEYSEEGSIKMEFDFDAIDEEDSPYPEVRASVSNVDDPEMPALTLRMWFVGLLLCMASSALNVFFNLRNPAPAVVPLALLLISYPFGKFLAFVMPIRTYRIPVPTLPRTWFPVHQPSFAPLRLFVNLLLPLTLPRAIEFSLNPGPWNIKEHVLVYIMANVAVGSPYAINAVIVMELYYEIHLNYWFSLTFVLATQLTGFGLAGMTRRFLVRPASMVWPQNLVCCALLNTLHAEDEDDGIGMYGAHGQKGMSRYKFFVICTAASFLWWFLPGYAFQALSAFSFVCWVAPTNVPINQLFGVESGLGMSFLTFDWPRIAWIGSPLMVPWWAEVNIFIGFVLFYWILVPVLYYTNTWQLAYFPISANEPFDRFGKSYNVTRVLTPEDRFDESAYFAYSPLYLPATYAMTYLLAFSLSTCVIVHTALYHGYQLYSGIRKIRIEEDDIHTKLMKNYKEVPNWWYAIGFAVCFALAVVAVEVWDTGVPVWSLLLAMALPVLYILPSGFIFAMTGQTITINILAQIIPGTLLPGNPFANMVFKAYSVQTLSAATNFVQDLKLGHYIKVPPRATFLVQMIGTALAAFVQVGVKHWIFRNIHDVCSPDQAFNLTCPYNQVFFTASAVWGLIGPSRQFGTGSIYHPHLYAILAGVFLPIPFWVYQRRYPKSWVRYVSIPVILNGVSKIPPSTGINYSSWILVGFVFQYLIRRRNFAWWGKFNYVLASALDSGSVIGVIFIFFTLQFPKSRDLKWWGNGVYQDTADHKRTPLYQIPSGGLPWSLLRPTATGAPQPT